MLAARRACERLGRGDEAGGVLDEFVPAAGQGALALEARAGAIDRERLAPVSATPTATACVHAPSATLVHALGASCNTPVGAHARPRDDGRLDARPPGSACPTARPGCATR